MGLLAIMKRLFTGAPAAPAQDVAPERTGPDAAAVANALLSIAEHLRRDAEERRSMLPLLERLPESLQTLPEIARQQARLGEAIGGALVQQKLRDQGIEEILRRIAEGVGHQTSTFGLVQQQLDLNHQAAQRVADGVTSLSQGVGELSTGQRRNADALQAIVEHADRRDAAMQRLTERLQVWLVFCTAIAAGSLLACLLLAWALLRGTH
jgi:X-X-X-Leu-X-X-Gly heptad repeat protein